MSATYVRQIKERWDWEEVVRDSLQQANAHVHDETLCDEGCDDTGHMGFAFLGTVLNNAPSGKLYAPWTTNQTEQDVQRDGRWFAALEKVAGKHGGSYTSGEGDPNDLFFERYWPNLGCPSGCVGKHDHACPLSPVNLAVEIGGGS